MSNRRRKTDGDLGTRAALIAATEQLLLEEGAASISTRRIGEKAGVKPPLIHYYFDTIDDLYLAVFRRNIEHSPELISPDEPIGALWAMEDDPRVKLGNELTALAGHRPALRAELTAYAEQARDSLVAALEQRFEHSDAPPDIPPIVLAVLLTSVGRSLRLERTLGITRGHEETNAFVAKWLERIENMDKRSPPSIKPAPGRTK